MKKKTLVIGILAVVIVSILLSFLTITLSSTIKKSMEISPIVGKWIERDTGVTLEFTKEGQMTMMDSVFATSYEIDEANQMITYIYTENYGGTESSMSYVLSENQTQGVVLTLTNTKDKSTNNYIRNDIE